MFWKDDCRPLIGKQEAAFTLLEVMVAVAIIAIAFVALLSSQSQSISLAAMSRFQTTAFLLARQKLTELEIAGVEQLSSGSGDFGEDFADWHWQTEVTELSEDETGIAGSSGILKLVELKVSRGDDEDEVFAVRTVAMTKIEPAEGN